MGISLSQYRAAIGLWRPSAQCKLSLLMDITLLRASDKTYALGLINIASLISIIVGLTATIISRQCLQALLLISGVEKNPGPVTQHDILGELSIKAPDEQTKNVLRAYPLGVALSFQKVAINRFKKDELIAALKFLRTPDQERHNKPQLVHNLIVRIQNLFPDTCGLCKEEYCVNLEDDPLLSCEICGQGSHDSCIKSVLEESADCPLDSATARKLINPLGIVGVHYLCMSCSEDNIPKENEGILKKKAHEVPDAEGITSGNTQPSDPTGGPSNPSVPVGQGSIPIQQVPGGSGPSNPASPVGQQVPVGDGSQPQPQPQPVSPQAGMVNRPICHFYKKGQCRHGTSGRGCKDRHPQPCKKLLRYGASLQNGCTLGRARCDKWHPSMCPASMTKGQCTDTSCKLWHVAGTRRAASNFDPTLGHQAGTKGQAPGRTPSKEIPKDFLGFLQSWKVEMMQAMDAKISMALKSAIPSPNPFSMEPPSMVVPNHVLPQNYYNLALGGQRGLMVTPHPLAAQMAPTAMYH